MNNSRSPLNRHLSLSASNISSPIAESTHIASLHQKFPWGGDILHSPSKNNSTIYNRSNLSSRTSFTPFHGIDPRIYSDIHSKGLASRIVKYHENSSKLHRSASVNNLYNKPGQFPVVHLKKNEIPYKAHRNRNCVSMVRIAPPDKSVFHANTRSSILRTGSVVPTIGLGLQKSDDEVSNRPILHPVVESDISPTRSVLDALKEISRKRINSDDLDGNDSIKKYCIEPENENVNSLPPASSTNNQNSIGSVYNNVSVTTKRQREITTTSTSPSAKISNIQKSPEQNGIKRHRVNNEFTSSISSSLSMLTPKRKLSEQSISSSSTLSNEKSPSYNPPSAKQQCHLNFRESDLIESYNLNNTVSLDQITPIPPTPIIEPFANRNAGEPFRTISEPIIKKVESKVPQKPKLTLFNKDYEKSANKNNNYITANDDDIPKIAFVKPKSDNSISGGNSIIERTQKTKLALMLSGLRGDLDEEDDIDSGNNHRIEEKSDEQNKEVSKSVNNIQTPSISSAAPILRSNIATESLGKEKLSNPLTVQFKPMENTKSSTVPNESGKGGFKFDLTQAVPSNQDVNKNSEKDNQTLNVVTLSPKGFSLGKPIATVTSLPLNQTIPSVPAVTASNNINFTQSIPKPTALSNNAASQLIPTTTISNVSTTQPQSVSTSFTIPAANNFNFGTKNTLSNSTFSATPANTSNTFAVSVTPSNTFAAPVTSTISFSAPVTSTISFSNTTNASFTSSGNNTFNSAMNSTSLVNNENNLNNLNKTKTAEPAKQIGGFSFGETKLTQSPPKSNLFTFNNATTTSTNSTNTFNVSGGNKTFSFSASPQSATNQPASAVSSVSSTLPTNTFAFGTNEKKADSTNSTQPAQNTFAFNANNTAKATPAPFTFGSSAFNTTTTIPSNTSFSFVSSNNHTESNKPTNIFGTTTDPKPMLNTINASAPQPTNSVISFNTGNASNNIENKNIFGSNSSNLSNKTFTFGNSNQSVEPSKEKTTTSIFGSNAMTTFGSNAAASPITGSNTFGFGTNSTNPTSNVFGGNTTVTNNISANSTENKSSPFGSSSTTSIGNPLQKSATFNFGSVNNANNTTGSFSFDKNLNTNNTNLNNTPGTFNFGENKPSTAVAPASSFNTNNQANPSTGFSFGQINSTNNFNPPANNANNANTTFSFGNPPALGASNNQTFSFTGGSTPAPPATNKPAAFNFTGNSTTNNVFGTPSLPAANTSNMFNPGNNPAPGPTDRPIRKATRRLHK